jgi:hypothetical protein
MNEMINKPSVVDVPKLGTRELADIIVRIFGLL